MSHSAIVYFSLPDSKNIGLVDELFQTQQIFSNQQQADCSLCDIKSQSSTGRNESVIADNKKHDTIPTICMLVVYCCVDFSTNSYVLKRVVAPCMATSFFGYWRGL